MPGVGPGLGLSLARSVGPKAEVEAIVHTERRVVAGVDTLKNLESDDYPPEALKGIDGVVETDALLKDKGAVGILVGGMLRVMSEPEITGDTLTRKDIDVVIMNEHDWVPEKKWEGGVDWWAHNTDGVITSPGAYSPGETGPKVRHIEFAYSAADRYKCYMRREPGLYIPDLASRNQIFYAEMAKKITEEFFTDGSHITDTSSDFEAKLWATYETAWNSNRDVVFEDMAERIWRRQNYYTSRYVPVEERGIAESRNEKYSLLFGPEHWKRAMKEHDNPQDTHDSDTSFSELVESTTLEKAIQLVEMAKPSRQVALDIRWHKSLEPYRDYLTQMFNVISWGNIAQVSQEVFDESSQGLRDIRTKLPIFESDKTEGDIFLKRAATASAAAIKLSMEE